MKILYLTNSFPNKGSVFDGIFNLRRVEKLIENNIHVEVINYHSIIQKKNISLKNSYNLKDLGFNIDLEVKVINYFNFYPVKKFLINKIKNIFQEEKFDLIHAHFVWNGYLCYLLKSKFNIPYILTVHGSDIHTEPFKSIMNRQIALKALSNADQVIFVSKYLVNKAKELGYKGDNFTVIPNGFDDKKFRMISENENHIKIKNNNEKIIGFVGGLDPVKRADKFPMIFSIIHKLYENSKLLIVGDGILRNQIENMFMESGLKNKVIITGNVHPDEVPYYINNMDVIILPSEKEGFPCVVPEALACGVPIVATNNGGIPEAVGDCGYLIPDGNNFENRFAEAVVKLLNINFPKEKTTERSKEFTWDIIVKKEIAAYKQII